jgi:hypothetical protein
MYLQMIGRGLRTSPETGKRDCLILDHSGCVHRLGFAADELQWTLDGHADLAATKAARERASGKDVTCPECQCVYSGGRTCPECGHYIRPCGREILTLDGELIEVGGHLGEDEQAKLVFFSELRGLAEQRGFKPGFAYYKFHEKFGHEPPRGWRHSPSARPSLETRNWVQSRKIAWLKSRPRDPA